MSEKVYFIHSFVGLTDGRATVAVERDPNCKKIFAGVAWCSPKDQFSKKLGRKISLGRLQYSRRAAPDAETHVGEYDPAAPVTRAELISLLAQVRTSEVRHGKIPQWAKDHPLLFSQERKMNKYGVVLIDSAKNKTHCACGASLDSGKACPAHGTEPLEVVAVAASKPVAEAIRHQDHLSVSMGCSAAEAPCKDCNKD